MANNIQPVDNNDFYRGSPTRVFNMIDNYIYLYHTKTLIAIPTYPDEIADTMAVQFSQATPLSRSAPIYSYVNSGPRSFAVTLNLHREMLNQINIESSNLKITDLARNDYMDILIKQLYATVLPRYAASEKMVDPPIVAIRFGEDIFCKGVITGGLTVNYSGPILRTNKYAQVSIDFTISEIDPYDADAVMGLGGFRGLSTDLERNVWKSGSGSNTTTLT